MKCAWHILDGLGQCNLGVLRGRIRFIDYKEKLIPTSNDGQHRTVKLQAKLAIVNPFADPIYDGPCLQGFPHW